MNKHKNDKKKYYCKSMTMKTKRHEELTDTIFGILITTDKNKEKNAVKDSYNILNDAVEHLYPDLLKKLNETNYEKVDDSLINKNEIFSPVQEDTNCENELMKASKKQKLDENSSKITNVSDQLENELKHVRSNKAKFFYNFETNCKGVIFIKIEKSFKNELDVKNMTKYIINKIKESKEQISRNISRFVPIEIAMKAKFDLFKKNAPSILDKYFTKPDSTENNSTGEKRISWKLEFKSRNNTSINKIEFLDFMINYIDKNRYYVDYKTPELIVLIEITNDLLCLSILEDYYENKCYNLMTLSKSDEELKSEREKLMKMQLDKEIEKKSLKEKELVESKNGNKELVEESEANRISSIIENTNDVEAVNQGVRENENSDNYNEDDDDDIQLI